jgi:zinc transporter, ZIP family
VWLFIGKANQFKGSLIVSSAQIALLGAIAGFTIFLGLPVGRISARLPQTKTALNAVAIGILVFLLWDVLTHAWDPIDKALAHHEIGDALTRGAVLTLAFGVGLLGLVWFDGRSRNQQPNGAARGPGAATLAELSAPSGIAGAGRLAVMIAAGIGLHNFAEGLTIGNSSRGRNHACAHAGHRVRPAQRHRRVRDSSRR